MSQVNNWHLQAMDLAERAFLAKRGGDAALAGRLTREAFQLERQAAEAMIDQWSVEPTRSVLLRSAASLAIDCREYREAERLLAAGLAGDPPPEIALELRELLGTVYGNRSLALPDTAGSTGMPAVTA